jgi:importin-5
MAISVLGEGAQDVMKESLSQVMDLVLPYTRDASPRVRYACCNCLGQMCTDFGPGLQREYNEGILGGLVPLMEDVGNPRYVFLIYLK